MDSFKSSSDWCCVPGCRSDGRKKGKYPFMRDVQFFPFPGEKRNPKMRKRWLQYIMRPEDYEPKRSHRVCSLHFVDGRPTLNSPVPTLFPRNDYGQQQSRRGSESIIKREKACQMECDSGITVEDSHLSDVVMQENRLTPSVDYSGYFSNVPPVVRFESVCSSSPVMSESEWLKPDDFKVSSEHNYSALSRAECPDFAEASCQTDLTLSDIQEFEQLKENIEKNPDELLRDLFISKITRTDKSVQQYTGIPSKSILNGLFDILDSTAPTLKYWTGQSTTDEAPYQKDKTKKKTGPKRKLTKYQEFILTLVRLRLALVTYCLSDLFGISTSRVTQIFTTWMNLMYMVFTPLLKWPKSSRVKKNLPRSFKSSFPRTTSIIDCTEFFIEKPRCPTAQSQTYSSYKHRNTYKALVSITPSGAFNFISDLWGGNVSDRYITNECGFLDNIKPGDEVMADRGFNIRDLLLERRATLNIPPFTRKCSWGKGKRLNAAEIKKTKSIACLRIHVERAIERLKNFRILAGTMSLKMKNVANQILKVCGFFCNLYKPLVRK